MSDAPATYFRVTYRDPHTNETTTLRAREVGDSSLGLGFICVSGFVFGKTSRIVDPAEEALARRLEDVKRLHLHLYAVLAIEEVGAAHQGLSFDNDRSKLLLLPTPSTDEA